MRHFLRHVFEWLAETYEGEEEFREFYGSSVLSNVSVGVETRMV